VVGSSVDIGGPMTDFGIIDSHCHFWDQTQFKYNWLEGVCLNQKYLVEDFYASKANKKIESLVFVECVCDYENVPSLKGEVLWVQTLAKQNPLIRGIVAGLPLGENIDTVKSLLTEYSTIDLVTGVRRVTQGESPNFVLNPLFIEGVHLAHQKGYSIDLCLKSSEQQEAVNTMVQNVSSDIQWILDHAGKPFIKEKIQDPWREQMNALARNMNVSCKLSGLVTEADHLNWTKEDLQPFIDHIILVFGVERVLYGSDWPVSLLATKNYATWVELLSEIVSGLPEDQQKQIFRDNAQKMYLSKQC